MSVTSLTALRARYILPSEERGEWDGGREGGREGGKEGGGIREGGSHIDDYLMLVCLVSHQGELGEFSPSD